MKGEGLGGRDDFAGPLGQGGWLLLPLGAGKREVAQVWPEHVKASVDRRGPYRRQSFWDGDGRKQQSPLAEPCVLLGDGTFSFSSILFLGF